MRGAAMRTMASEAMRLEAMYFDLRPARRLTDDGPEQGASGHHDHKRLARPGAAGSGSPERGARGGQSSEVDETRGDRRTPIRCLAMGAASEVGRPETFAGQALRASSDFADVVPLGRGRIALILGDVCSGDRAATRRVPQILSALRPMLGGHAHPADALGALNRALCGADSPAAYRPVLLSLAVLDVGTGEAACACAGSEPPLILRSGGSVEAVNAGTMGLGVDAKWAYRAVDFLLREGDALLLATDGVAGAGRARGGESGESLSCEGLAGLALDAFRAGGPPGQVARSVLAGAKAFAGGALRDDASVLVAVRQ